ncbi:hypothetical protein NE237_028548 [Protea cynaroides]|uniref:ADP/ATP translocase n=1 Tax=Protea cynaroides TaxID=273540 RepID=A0A9Q0GRD5_9MAGN|nr:hypothetical protein NE237_028548 [Protea cynaroides]
MREDDEDEKEVGTSSRSFRWLVNFHKDLMAGAVLGGVVHTIVAPIERAKLLLQTQESNLAIVGDGGHRRFKGMLDCIVRTVREEGRVSSLYGGVMEVVFSTTTPLLPSIFLSRYIH